MRFGGDDGDGPIATLDHVIPISRGGTEDEDNFQLLCHECNGKKRDILEPRVDGGPHPLPALSPTSEGSPVNRKTIAKFWGLRCGLCGRLEPCIEHEGQAGTGG